MVALGASLAVVGGVVSWLALELLDVPGAALGGASVALAVAGAGILAPDLMVRAGRYWNRAAKLYVGFVRRAVIRIFHVCVVVPVGWTGGRLSLDGPEERGSGWIERSSLDPACYPSEGRHAPGPTGGSERGSSDEAAWPVRYVQGCVRAGQTWAVGLLPAFLLLRATKIEGVEDASEAPDANIYTLY